MNDQDGKKLLIIFNPTAGRRQVSKFQAIVAKLKANGLSLDIVETKSEGHATRAARDNVTSHYDMIVAAGGDGTINEVINGLCPYKIPLAIIPLGTVNVLALEIKLKTDINSIVKYLMDGIVKECWLGKINDHYYSLMLSVGHDAKSVQNVSKTLKKYFGRAAYIISYLASVIKNGNTLYKVTIDNKVYQASNVIVCNGKLYGGHYICAPDASLSDETMFVLLAKKKGRLSALKYAFLMVMQKYPFSRSIEIIETRSLYIESNEMCEPIQTDGDSYGTLPGKVSISDESLNLLYPIG
ncbi:MAG: diacylglycerol kinase family lipid kinase [Emcibacteraceae bacterium]|nr:diacylglycerol kinase family lipid kinase [Emcibacteraceae bacterium]